MAHFIPSSMCSLVTSGLASDEYYRVKFHSPCQAFSPTSGWKREMAFLLSVDAMFRLTPQALFLTFTSCTLMENCQ